MLDTWIPWNNLLITTYEKCPVLSWETTICQHLISNYTYWEIDDATLLSGGGRTYFPLLNPKTDRDDWTLLISHMLPSSISSARWRSACLKATQCSFILTGTEPKIACFPSTVQVILKVYCLVTLWEAVLLELGTACSP